ncbi:uncharacterized protein [Henckelia pumila]|uniref:uncharacterized protein n=1 Tax=Henckelia pumila TaxID=405737 RepID=UPI003C6E5DCC
MLRSGKGFQWTEECQQAFDELKVHLTSPPLLVKPNEGDTLLIYLAISAEVVSAVLVSEVGHEHKPVYYISQTLHGAEIKIYKDRETGTGFASGRMVKWAVELSQYGIEYRTRPAIKTQILADFLVKMTVTQEESSTQTWMVYVDGSSTSKESGAEYEAFIMGIKLTLSVRAKRLTIHSDSQLIISQVNGNYEAKEDKMLEYLTEVNELLSCLDSYDIKQIPRGENESADRLANEEPSWKDEIIDYLKQEKLPANQVEA